MGKLHDIEGFK